MRLTELFSRITVLVLLLGFTFQASAQGTVTGTVVDSEDGISLVGATVVLEGTNRGAITGPEGEFSIEAPEAGTYNLIVSYFGYQNYTEEISIVDSETTKTGSISLVVEAVGIGEVNILASLAVDRKTPVAVTTIDGSLVEQLAGNQEFTEVLRSAPSIYVTKEGGGFGDSRINVRGFDQRNTAVMINGIPVNDMENGWVYWSNWAGLADVTSTIQVQRGLGASKLAVASVGGSINIVTDAAEMRKGGSFAAGVGNDGFQKYSLVLSSGLNDNGFAVTGLLSHTRGNGYVDGTSFEAYSYFLSATKRFNKSHSLSATVVGAPQWHHQRLYNRFASTTLQTFVDQGERFNTDWGTYEDKEFSWRRNFYHKPKMFLNHYWNISDKTSLKSSAYVSFGLGGGTGPRGRVQNDQSFFFDSFSDFETGPHDENGQTRFDDLAAYNGGTTFEEWGTKDAETEGTQAGNYVTTSSGDGFIRRASMNYHNWYGILSTLDHKVSDNLTITAGLDGRYYKGIHFRRLENLLGNDAYLSRGDDNNPENYITETSPANFGNFYDNSYKTGNNVLNYWNDGLVTWLGLFAQVEYSTEQLSVFGSVSGSNQGFARVDYFNYSSDDTEANDINDDGEYFQSPWVNKLGGTAKAGVNYNLNETMNVFVNAGFFSRQPIFDNVFLNFRNEINEDVQNQTVTAFEAGYGYRSGIVNAKVNVYHTLWGNRQFDEGVQVQINDTTQVEGLAVFENVSQLHQGLELELEVRPIHQLRVTGMFSLGNWRYTDNFTTTITDTDNGTSLGESTLYAEGLKVGDAAQITGSLRASYEVFRGVEIYASYFYADGLYAPFNVNEDQFFSPDPEVLQLPSYSLVDAGAMVEVPVGNVTLQWMFNMNNVLGTSYIAELETNDASDLSTTDVGALTDTEYETFLGNNFGFFGFGRTWNTTLKVLF